MNKKVWMVIAVSIVVFIVTFFCWVRYQFVQCRLDFVMPATLDVEFGVENTCNIMKFMMMKPNAWNEIEQFLRDDITDIEEDFSNFYIAKNSENKIIIVFSETNSEDLILPDLVTDVSKDIEKAHSILYIEPDYDVEFIVDWFIPRYIWGWLPKRLNDIENYIDRYIF